MREVSKVKFKADLIPRINALMARIETELHPSHVDEIPSGDEVRAALKDKKPGGKNLRDVFALLIPTATGARLIAPKLVEGHVGTKMYELEKLTTDEQFTIVSGWHAIVLTHKAKKLS